VIGSTSGPALIRTIDAHAGGQPLRLIAEGWPSPRGATMAEKAAWLKRRADHLRRSVLLEPRGHLDLSAALFTEAVSPGAHAGILFLDADGYRPMSGHGVIAATTIALERGLLVPGGDGRSVVFDTPAGTVRTRSVLDVGQGNKVAIVMFANVPSFVLHAGIEIRTSARRVRADIAFGGEFYAIVDGESAGLSIDAPHLPELRRIGEEIRRAAGAAVDVVHPADPTIQGLGGTVFIGPPRAHGADLQNVTIFAGGAVDRSPCGTATSAVMAVIDAMGMLARDRPFVHEGLIGTTLEGRVVGRAPVGDREAIHTEIAGSAWITGEHVFWVDPRDPFALGYTLGQ
jgi:proline racemase